MVPINERDPCIIGGYISRNEMHQEGHQPKALSVGFGRFVHSFRVENFSFLATGRYTNIASC